MPTIVALGEMLIDFAPVAADAAGYPTLKAQAGRCALQFSRRIAKIRLLHRNDREGRGRPLWPLAR